MRLVVLDQIEGRDGEARYLVCKETATSPSGKFSVRVDAVEPCFK